VRDREQDAGDFGEVVESGVDRIEIIYHCKYIDNKHIDKHLLYIKLIT
jgi:hypothetical protein